jgi:hypothetical protein
MKRTKVYPISRNESGKTEIYMVKAPKHNDVTIFDLVADWILRLERQSPIFVKPLVHVSDIISVLVLFVYFILTR